MGHYEDLIRDRDRQDEEARQKREEKRREEEEARQKREERKKQREEDARKRKEDAAKEKLQKERDALLDEIAQEIRNIVDNLTDDDWVARGEILTFRRYAQARWFSRERVERVDMATIAILQGSIHGYNGRYRNPDAVFGIRSDGTLFLKTNVLGGTARGYREYVAPMEDVASFIQLFMQTSNNNLTEILDTIRKKKLLSWWFGFYEGLDDKYCVYRVYT